MMRRLPAIFASLLAVASCHAVFDGEIGTVHCDDEGAYGSPACPDGESCSEGICSAIGAPIGRSCDSDEDCAEPAFCLDPASVGQVGPKRCAQTCCTSLDCGDPRHGQVCWALPGGGGSLCWPHDALDREPPGATRATEACSAGTDCRSGACIDGTCVDGCCDDASCPPSEICRLKLVPALAPHDSWTCGPPGSQAVAPTCDSNDDCASARCAPASGAAATSLCAKHCCGSATCGDTIVAGTSYRVACGVLDDQVKSCNRILPMSADGGVGAACANDLECRSGQCLAGSCSDLCCIDEDCGDPSAFSCSPATFGASWALRCVRK
jgi:hypothetical protein